jgi:hypothetical protein
MSQAWFIQSERLHVSKKDTKIKNFQHFISKTQRKHPECKKIGIIVQLITTTRKAAKVYSK